MRVPLDWLKDYIDNQFDAAETSDALTMMGLEVEEVEQAGASGAPVLNIKVMSNRGDCLSMIGVARELAADQNVPLKYPSFEATTSGDPASSYASVEIADPDLCYRYAATVIRGVKIGPSPDWLANRLLAAGMRPINCVVDVTNYVMLETGQPLHAFDYDLIGGHKIVVRRARAGEKIETLDGQKRNLEPDMLAICDESRPVAIAGVMGGAETEVSEKTVNILLESACFNGSSVRKTARELNLPTEASYRFERGVDLGGTVKAALRASELIRELAGGEVCPGVVDTAVREAVEVEITLRPERVKSTLGVELSADECAGYLRRLDIRAEVSDGKVAATIPSFRADLTQEIDLIEEIGRIYGFNNLPTTLIDSPSLQGKDSPRGELESEVRIILKSQGLQEVVTHSIVAEGVPDAPGRTAVKLKNVLSRDVAQMRTTLIPGGVQVLGHNFSRGVRHMAIFEIGRVFCDADGPSESSRVAGCMMGSRWDGQWIFSDKKLQPAAFSGALVADFYQAKGVVELLLSHLGLIGIEFKVGASGCLRAGYTADVVYEGRVIGQVGEVSSALRDLHNLKQSAFAWELDMDALAEGRQLLKRWQAPSKFPAVRRDIAAVVDEGLPYQQAEQTIAQAGSGLIESVALLDVFKGEQLGQSKKCLAFAITFRSGEKTLTDEEVNTVLADIKGNLVESLGASFRE